MANDLNVIICNYLSALILFFIWLIPFHLRNCAPLCILDYQMQAYSLLTNSPSHQILAHESHWFKLSSFSGKSGCSKWWQVIHMGTKSFYSDSCRVWGLGFLNEIKGFLVKLRTLRLHLCPGHLGIKSTWREARLR